MNNEENSNTKTDVNLEKQLNQILSFSLGEDDEILKNASDEELMEYLFLSKKLKKTLENMVDVEE